MFGRPSSHPNPSFARQFNKDPLQTAASGYGYGHHETHHDSYGHHGGYSSGYHDCCPLVVDPLTYAALLGFLAAATYLLQTVIAASALVAPGRKKRSFVMKGKPKRDTYATFFKDHENGFGYTLVLQQMVLLSKI